MENDYNHLLGSEIETDSGLATIKSIYGKYGTLEYKECSGIGWVDLSTTEKD